MTTVRVPSRGAVPAAVLTALLAAVLLLGPAGTAAGADNGQWSVLPAANAVGQRPYFYLAAAPGRSAADTVTVTNRSDRPRTFRLYAADAYNTARDGGFALRGPDEPRLATAAWVTLDRERVTVPAGGPSASPSPSPSPNGRNRATTPAPSWPWRTGPPPPRPGGSACSRPSPPACTCA